MRAAVECLRIGNKLTRTGPRIGAAITASGAGESADAHTSVIGARGSALRLKGPMTCPSDHRADAKVHCSGRWRRFSGKRDGDGRLNQPPWVAPQRRQQPPARGRLWTRSAFAVNTTKLRKRLLRRATKDAAPSSSPQ